MIGVWCAEAWKNMGKPERFALVELGPGRGTMMRDILRATAKVAGFSAAKNLYLIDSDKALRKIQREKLADEEPFYVDSVDRIPSMPSLIIANEFFDALPLRQLEKGFRGWTERMVVIDKKDALALQPRALDEAELNLVPLAMREAAPGTIFEFAPQAQTVMRDLSRRLATQKGALLIVDYGYVASSGAATLQAVSQHKFADIFDRPGEVDLTGHVDFAALAEIARDAGLDVSPIIGQGEFLANFGIEIRADGLKRRATLPQAAAIEAELHRLIDEDQMGTLFKVMEING